VRGLFGCLTVVVAAGLVVPRAYAGVVAMDATGTTVSLHRRWLGGKGGVALNRFNDGRFSLAVAMMQQQERWERQQTKQNDSEKNTTRPVWSDCSQPNFGCLFFWCDNRSAYHTADR